MTATDTPLASSSASSLREVTLDLYRDIHKGIRTELFDVTARAGRTDPGDRRAKATLAGRLSEVVELLVDHAHHEDTHVQPSLEQHLPADAERIAVDHERLERRMDGLRGLAAASVQSSGSGTRHAAHRLYVELAAFTSAYLAHQDDEERVVMPALEDAIGPDAVLAIHRAIVGGIPPEEMAKSLAVMLPAMNLEDRVDLLGGMRADAPPEAFAGVWNLTGEVLAEADRAAVATRLELT